MNCKTESPSAATFAGVFLISVATLMYQNLLARVFSLTMWYHFGFMAISIAMFGMTLGALLIYLLPSFFPKERAQRQISLSALAFAFSLVLGFVTHLSLPFNTSNDSLKTIPGLYAIVLTYAAIAIPFCFSGICITLVLTNFPRQISRFYAADLTGAAIGCVVLIYVLKIADAPSAVLLTGLLASLSAILFTVRHDSLSRLRKWSVHTAFTFAFLAVVNILLANAQSSPLRLIYVRGVFEPRPLHERWNSFSRIAVFGNPRQFAPPVGWGLSSLHPGYDRPVRQLMLNIDGGANTTLTAFHGDLAQVDFLKYDITNLAHYIRSNGHILVIGAGGGRDVLSALLFKQQSIVAVEFNEATIDMVNNRFGDFTGHLDRDPRVHFVNDEARSYMARQGDRYDIIQVSLIDTWAATTAGAFVFTENSLYTIEGWKILLDRLKPNGVLSFSRWYFRDRPSEMYRLTALACASLKSAGIANPRDHLMIARRMYGPDQESPHGIGTLLVSKAPFTSGDIAAIEQVSGELRFEQILTPSFAADPAFAAIASPNEPDTFVKGYPINIAPPTDDSPFFFQMLRLRDIFNSKLQEQGAATFNQHAVRALGLLLIVMLFMTLLGIIVPLGLRARSMQWTSHGALLVFFISIGFGFMLIEMSQMQRLAIFLGHPTYGLSVVLFTLLLSSGAGSFLTRRIHARSTGILCLAAVLAVLFLFGFLTPRLIVSLQSLTTPLRIATAVALISPIGLVMGTALPLGIKVATEANAALIPWLWGVNGAASISASVLALVISFSSSISTSFWIGFACYALAGTALVMNHLQRRAKAPAIEPGLEGSALPELLEQ